MNFNMKAIRCNQVIQGAKSFVKDNGSTILVTIGLAGFGATVVSAVKQTPKAMEIKSKAEEGRNEPLSKLETVQKCWKVYIPTAIIGTTSIGCILGSHLMSLKKEAALAAVIAASDRVLKDIQDDKVEKIHKDLEIEKDSETLCYDEFSGRTFMIDLETLGRTENIMNKDMLSHGKILLNELYFALGLDGIPIGNEYGWDLDLTGLMDMNVGSKISDTGKLMLTMGFNNKPIKLL